MFERKLGILEEILGDYRQQRDEFLFYCPFCKHYKKKLSINIRKNVWHCWVCDTRNNDIYWIIREYGTEKQKSEWRNIAGIIDQSDEENQNFLEQKIVESIPISLPKQFRTLTTKKASVLSLPARRYLANRGITQYDIAWWKMGYCPDGEYKERVIIPSFDLDGNVNYFVARNYKNDFISYKNPSAPHNLLFNELYLDLEKDVILVEGIFDAVVAGNAIPLLGSTLREDSYILERLVFSNANVFIALDPDAHGSKEDKIIKLLLNYGLQVWKIDVEPYKDVGSMPKKIFQERKQMASNITNDSIFERMLISV